MFPKSFASSLAGGTARVQAAASRDVYLVGPPGAIISRSALRECMKFSKDRDVIRRSHCWGSSPSCRRGLDLRAQRLPPLTEEL